MKIIDKIETTATTTTKNKQRQKRTRGAEALVKGWELNDFVEHLR